MVRCSRCRLLRLNPRPDDEGLASLQQRALGDAPDQVGSFETGNVNTDYPAFLTAQAPGHGFPARGGRLLDLGCGSGEIAHALSQALAAWVTGSMSWTFS